MLIGFTREDKMPTTVIVGADEFSEYESFVAQDYASVDNNLFLTAGEPDLFSILSDEVLKRFSERILLVTHPNTDAQKKYIESCGIKIMKPLQTIKFHERMIEDEAERKEQEASPKVVVDAGIRKTRVRNTIGRITGYDEYDPHDNMTDEDREKIKKLKAKKKEHKGLTGESFSGNLDKADSGLQVHDVRHLSGGDVEINAVKGFSGASKNQLRMEARQVPQEILNEKNQKKLFSAGVPLFLPLDNRVPDEEIQNWLDENAQAWVHKINGHTWLFKHPEDLTKFEGYYKELQKIKTDRNDPPVSETIGSSKPNVDSLKNIFEEMGIGDKFTEIKDKLSGPILMQKPVPQDFRFQYNEDHTKNPSIAGPNIIVFSFSTNPKGPGKGQWDMGYGINLLREADMNFQYISNTIFCYEGILPLEDVKTILLEAGFVEEENLVEELREKTRKKLASLKNKEMEEVDYEPSPEELASVLAGDGTSAADGTRSFGRHVVGISDSDRETLVQTPDTFDVAVVDILDGLITTDLKHLGNSKDADEDEKKFASIVKHYCGNHLENKKLRWGPYCGHIQPGGRHILPLDEDDKIVFTFNTIHLGVTKFGDKTEFHVFVRDKSNFVSFIAVKRVINEQEEVLLLKFR